MNLDPFLKDSQDIEVESTVITPNEVESIVVTPNVSSSSKSLEFFTIVYQVIPSVSFFNECLKLFLGFL